MARIVLVGQVNVADHFVFIEDCQAYVCFSHHRLCGHTLKYLYLLAKVGLTVADDE